MRSKCEMPEVQARSRGASGKQRLEGKPQGSKDGNALAAVCARLWTLPPCDLQIGRPAQPKDHSPTTVSAVNSAALASACSAARPAASAEER